MSRIRLSEKECELVVAYPTSSATICVSFRGSRGRTAPMDLDLGFLDHVGILCMEFLQQPTRASAAERQNYGRDLLWSKVLQHRLKGFIGHPRDVPFVEVEVERDCAG